MQELPERPRNRYWLHLLLFLLTLTTTTLAGSDLMAPRQFIYFFDGGQFDLWQAGKPSAIPIWSDVLHGLAYSLSFLFFLTAHEFGHYFTALYHRVRSSLPYYIPLYIPGMPINIGSMGAIIRLRSLPDSTRKFFDIGVAGPLAGFVVSFGLLWYGFANLPPPDYLYNLHPEYKIFVDHLPSESEALALSPPNLPQPRIGTSLLFIFFEQVVADPARMPNHMELYHYPFLFVGFITLFFTAMNLLPIGQLDGGHVIYGLFGRVRAGLISRLTVLGLILMGGMGLVRMDWNLAEDATWIFYFWFYLLYLYFVVTHLTGRHRLKAASLIIAGVLAVQQLAQWAFPAWEPNMLWLLYSILGVKMFGLDHPPAAIEQPLDLKRKLLGWLAIVIFVLCFTPTPIDTVTRPAGVQKVTQNQNWGR